MTVERQFAGIGAAYGFMAVAAGAFGAHALKGSLSPDHLATFETAARYQMYHALALFGVAWAYGLFPGQWTKAAGWLFVWGTAIFSGSLYALALSGVSVLGAITPFGGLALLAGWASLGIGITRHSGAGTA